MSLFVHHTIFIGNQHLDKFSGHAKEGRGPHPKERRGPADVQRQGHPTDVPRAYRSRQGRGQGLKVGRIPGGVLIVVASCKDAPGVAEIAHLGKAQVDGEEDPYAKEQDGKVLGRT